MNNNNEWHHDDQTGLLLERERRYTIEHFFNQLCSNNLQHYDDLLPSLVGLGSLGSHGASQSGFGHYHYY